MHTDVQALKRPVVVGKGMTPIGCMYLNTWSLVGGTVKGFGGVELALKFQKDSCHPPVYTLLSV